MKRVEPTEGVATEAATHGHPDALAAAANADPIAARSTAAAADVSAPTMERKRTIPPGARPTITTVIGAFAFGVLLSFAAFSDAWLGMVQVWRNSETFTHGFIALPFAAWMIWAHRAEWAHRPVRTWVPALGLAALGGALWIIGRLAGVASAEQLGAVAVIPVTIAALVGPSMVMALAFPIAFLFFAVPIGEFLTPIMMDYTADATVLALQWTGVPVYREGLMFTVPTGRWSVVEACSGVRYLIASLALGVLYSYLQFRTLRYRLAFMLLSLIVPIVANWIRAYLIVMTGHLSDMRLAVGVDHLIYGWVFFGLVMLLLFWIGSRWREPGDPTGHAVADAALNRPVAPVDAFSGGRIAMALAMIAVVLMARPIAATMLDATEPIRIEAELKAALPGSPDRLPLPWTPVYTGATDSARISVDQAGLPIDAHAFYYARQHESTEMIHAGHSVVDASSSVWPVRARSMRETPWGRVAEYVIGHEGRNTLLVWHWYEVGGTVTPNPYVAKGVTAARLLAGRGDHSVTVVLDAPLIDESATGIEQVRQALQVVGEKLAPVTDAVSRGVRSR